MQHTRDFVKIYGNIFLVFCYIAEIREERFPAGKSKSAKESQINTFSFLHLFGNSYTGL